MKNAHELTFSANYRNPLPGEWGEIERDGLNFNAPWWASERFAPEDTEVVAEFRALAERAIRAVNAGEPLPDDFWARLVALNHGCEKFNKLNFAISSYAGADREGCAELFPGRFVA